MNKVKAIKVTLPADVADYYAARAVRYGTSVSAAAAPVLVALARDEIRQDFTRPAGSGDVGRP